jgi:hypothetical protein
MTYPEKRRLVIGSPAYWRLVRLFGVLFVIYGIATDGLMVRYYLTSGDLFPGGRQFFAISLLYWWAAAALLFVGAVLMLRFVVPAVMTDAQVRKSVSHVAPNMRVQRTRVPRFARDCSPLTCGPLGGPAE